MNCLSVDFTHGSHVGYSDSFFVWFLFFFLLLFLSLGILLVLGLVVNVVIQQLRGRDVKEINNGTTSRRDLCWNVFSFAFGPACKFLSFFFLSFLLYFITTIIIISMTIFP